MSEPFFLTAGDLLPTFVGQLVDEDGYPLDLTTAVSCVLRVRPSGVPSTFITASVAFSTATSGASAARVEHAWATSTVPTRADYYQAQFTVTKSDGRTLSIPNPGYVPLVVGTSMGG